MRPIFWNIFVALVLAGLVATGVFLFLQKGSWEASPQNQSAPAVSGTEKKSSPEEPPQDGETKINFDPGANPTGKAALATPNQQPLSNPPAVAKAIYMTAWTTGSPSRLKALEDMALARGINSVVIDIKDYSGYMTYETGLPEVAATGAEKELRVKDINAIIKDLHERNLYVIGRITVFQDPVLSKAHPEWSLKNKKTGKLWQDRKGLSWLDPAGNEVRDYYVKLAKNASERGFDEVNFDYIRFPSDGDLASISYPFWNEKVSRHTVMRGFFKHLRDNLPGIKISADLFGLTTYAQDDLGIGQMIEDAYPYFDYVCPMTYPSHYASGAFGFKNPADHPYEVLKYSLEPALARWQKQDQLSRFKAEASGNASGTSDSRPAGAIVPALAPVAKLRPWLQVFDLGAVYTREMINKQIQATEEVLNADGGKVYGGWLLWDPKNSYKNFQP